MTWYLVQFHSHRESVRLLDVAYEDGYQHGDRFLEGAEFEVSLSEDRSDFTVKATESTRDYLLSKHSSPEEWEKEIRDTLLKQGGTDTMFTDQDEDGWSGGEVHLAMDVNFYTDECGLTLEK